MKINSGVWATLTNLLVGVTSLLFFLSVLEVGTRLLWHPGAEAGHLGVILKGANRRLIYEGIEYRTNSLGLRNTEIDTGSVKGAKRILALGDSFLWGDGLPESDLVTAKIQGSLSTDFGNVDVINAGISAYNTSDELTQLIRLAPLYSPDIVIVFFFTNDVLQEDPSRAPVSWQQNTKEFLRHHSRFFSYLYYVYRDRLSSKVGTPKSLLPQDYFNLNDSKPGWVLFKQSALQIRNYCAQHRSQLLFVIIPTLTNLDENYPYAELRRGVRTFLITSGILHVDLFDAFSPYRPSDLWVSLVNPHWNGRATTIASDRITSYIRQHRLMERPTSQGVATTAPK
jgi:GDSL-like lipase/acylhydrolase family protein